MVKIKDKTTKRLVITLLLKSSIFSQPNGYYKEPNQIEIQEIKDSGSVFQKQSEYRMYPDFFYTDPGSDLFQIL